MPMSGLAPLGRHAFLPSVHRGRAQNGQKWEHETKTHMPGLFYAARYVVSRPQRVFSTSMCAKRRVRACVWPAVLPSIFWPHLRDGLKSGKGGNGSCVRGQVAVLTTKLGQPGDQPHKAKSGLSTGWDMEEPDVR